MLEFFDLANNPIFIKHFRSRLRRSAVVPALFMIFLASAVIVVVDANARDNDPNSTQGSQMFFGLQMILLIVAGGSQIASAIAQVRDSGILDFHRLTPVPSSVQTIGFLVGAPIREYLLYLVTIPFALYCALVCDVGIFGFAKLFLVQVAVVLMSHSVALITGLASRSARGASGTFVVVAMILNGSSIGLYNAGIYGPSLLSCYPVYHEVFIAKGLAQRQQQWQQPQQFPPPGVRPPGKQGQLAPQPAQQPANAFRIRPREEVTFYAAQVPVVLQCLFFQGTFVTFLFIAASRRIRSARIPMLSKKQALIFLSCVAFLTLGSLWGDTHQVHVIVGTVYFLSLLAIVLSALLTPDQGDFAKGLQRSQRLLGGHVPFWHDLTSMKILVPIFAVLVVVPAIIGALALPAPQANDLWLPWPPIATAFFTVLSFGFARQAMPLSVGKRWPSMFALYVVLVWGIPVAFGAVASALGVREAFYPMVISPLLGIVASSRLVFQDADQTAVLLLSIVPPIVLTVLFASILIVSENRVVTGIVDEREHRYPKVEEAV